MELERYTLHEDQRRAADFIKSAKCVLLKGDTGSGKTIVSVQTALEVGAKVILTIGPINTESSWRKTVLRQFGPEMPFHYITSKAAGKAAFQALHDGVPGYYYIGREYFRRFAWHKAKHIDFITLDEAHCASSRDSLMFKMLKTAKAPYKLAMSATPFGNRVEGAWSLARWLWPQHTPRGFWNWCTEWFETEVDPFKKSEFGLGQKVTRERNPGAMWNALPAAFKMKSVYNATPVIHEVEVELSREQRKHYKELEQEAITWLDDNPLAIDIPGVLYLRLQQITLAVPSIKQGWKRVWDRDSESWEKVWGDIVYFEEDAKSTKIDAVLEILSDLHAGEEKPAVMVYTHSRLFATMLTLRLQAKKYRARRFIGGMSPEERTWKIENFGVEFDVLVAVIPAIGEGTDSLQHKAHHEIWCSRSDSGILNEQAEGRLSRQGQTKTVNRYLIHATDTIETEKQLGRLTLNKAALDAGYNDDEEEAA